MENLLTVTKFSARNNALPSNRCHRLNSVPRREPLVRSENCKQCIVIDNDTCTVKQDYLVQFLFRRTKQK